VEQNRTNVSSERHAISGPAKAVIALLVVQLAVTIASALVTLVELGLLPHAKRGERVKFAEAEASDDRR